MQQVFNRNPVLIESGESFHELYPMLLEAILKQGQQVHPRGEPTLEISPILFTLENPRDCIKLQKCRRINYAYAVVEKLSLVYGKADPDTFCFYIPVLKSLLNEERVFGGAYGPRVTGQLDYIYHLLKRDPDSRRAVIAVYSSVKDQQEGEDIPCTLSLQFLLREGRLNLITNMRSNDVYLGLPYDVQQFTFLQQLMAHWLGAELGSYTHVASSAHVYEKDIKAAWRVVEHRSELNEQSEPPVDLNYDQTKGQVNVFFDTERELRQRGLSSPADTPSYKYLSNYLQASLDKVSGFILRKAKDKTQLRLTLPV